MATKTIEGPSHVDRERARELLRRGGPFDPTEYSAVGTCDPAELLAARFRQIAPTRSPEELEDYRRVEEKFGAKLAAAEKDLADAIATNEGATEKFFQARDALQAVQSTTWIVGGWGRGTYEQGGTPAQVEAATAQLEEAQHEWKSAGQREADARVKVTTIGMAAARELAAERTARKK